MGLQSIKTIGGCCQDCPDRHLGCHDTCDTYRDAKDAYESKKAMIKSARAEENEYTLYKYKKILKENRSKRS